MSKRKITGSFVALITPFNKDGSVDFPAFGELLRFQQKHGTAAVLIMGSTGETSMLSPEEKQKIIVETAKMKTGMPIFYGCTGNNTDATIANVRFAADNGADGAILAAPAYICAPEADIERFFLDVADATDLPLGIYNNPPRVKSDLALESSAAHFQASELRGAQGIDGARRPGGAGACRQAGRVGDVLRQPQSRPGGADHEPRRPRHRQHDRQYRARPNWLPSRRRGRAIRKRRTSRPPICGCCRCCISPIRRSIRWR